MNHMPILLLVLLSLGLSACVNQDQADEKMAVGCIAAANSLLGPQGKEIYEVKAKQFMNEENLDGLHRRIIIIGVEKEGWLELDKEYSCLFGQKWGLFKSSHYAMLVQLNINDEIYGKKDNKIIGNLNDFIKLTNTVNDAMGQ